MGDKTFFATNILVYCYTETESNKKAIAVGLAQSPEAWTSTQVLQELSNTLRKKFGKNWAEIAMIVEEVSQNFEIFANQPDTLREAIRIADRYGYSLYDGLILSSSWSVGCSIVYSEDMQSGQIIDGILKIVNPFRP